jgi:hypothetical protein
MILAGLDELIRGSQEMLRHARDNLVVVFHVDTGLIGN